MLHQVYPRTYPLAPPANGPVNGADILRVVTGPAECGAPTLRVISLEPLPMDAPVNLRDIPVGGEYIEIDGKAYDLAEAKGRHGGGFFRLLLEDGSLGHGYPIKVRRRRELRESRVPMGSFGSAASAAKIDRVVLRGEDW